MKYKIAIYRSDEGVSVSVPGLPGCWSQGQDEAEALVNIGDAIREYLGVVDEQLQGADVREIDVATWVPSVPGISQQRAVRALERAGFRVVREGKHIVMSDGRRILTIPRASARLTVERFKELL